MGQKSHMFGSYKTLVGRVRLVGAIEGISFLLLLGVAMPLKYYADMPEAVSTVGMAHGVLFLLFSLVLLHAVLSERLSFRWAVIAFIATLVPFGPFVIDQRLKHFDTP
jgi:integral membrane protein